ncbi:MAG TPA: Ku protein [Thermoanaerobaculia bacterium]|jgi:DNA end-binding protein Ku|nr:Ku protein [Thermoanaerobaculia bacterium]
MARAIWKGSITFGLVNIPVGLYGAESTNEISFHLLDQRDMAPVRYKRVNEHSGKEVPWDQIVRGYEFEKGKYVVVSDQDLKRASPEATQTVDIVDFVDLEEISPVYFDKPYYLGPDKKGAKSYALLRETLKRTGKVGIAKVVIRTKQHLGAVVPQGNVLVLNLLRFGHELRDADQLDIPSGKEGVSERELEMAERLVEGMVDRWDPDKYRDDYRNDVMKMIDERVKAGQLEAAPETEEEEPKPARGQVIDLMALLKRSVEERGSGSKSGAKKTAAKKPAAKKPAAKKTAAKKTAAKRATGSKRKSA